MGIAIFFIFLIIFLIICAVIYEANKNENNKKFEELVHKQKDLIEKNRAEGRTLQYTSELNNKGSILEKNGELEEAIKCYEDCIHFRHPATHAYDRLLVLYRKKREYEKELRVAREALKVFTQENERRANNATKKNPELKEEIELALETNDSVRKDDGFYCFNPYNVFKYIERIDKIKKLIHKKKQ